MWVAVICFQNPPPLFRLWCNMIPPQFPEVSRTELVYKAVQLCSKARTRICSPAQHSALDASQSLPEVVRGLHQLDVELKQFRDDNLAPGSMRPSKEAQSPLDWLTKLMSTEGAPAYSHTFKTFSDASGWMLITSTRMRVHHTILECLNHVRRSPEHLLTPDSDQWRHTSACSATELVDDLHTAVFSHLCMTESDTTPNGEPVDVSSLRGFCLLPAYGTALTVASTVLQHDPTRVASFRWARRLLLELERVLGFARASHLARVYQAIIDGVSGLKAHSALEYEGLPSSGRERPSQADREGGPKRTGSSWIPRMAPTPDGQQIPSAFMSESMAGGVLVTKYCAWRPSVAS